ncbi:MAG: hypothetical protein KC766_01105 [Myxococcales bacterium]|nr:hypothetical protein [Myxococcales bacterium]
MRLGGLRIDRQRFLTLTCALAASHGCVSREKARPASTLLVAPRPEEDEQPPPARSLASRCDTLAPCADAHIDDQPSQRAELCHWMVAEFLPDVAARGIRCLEQQPAACDASDCAVDVERCAWVAFENVRPTDTEECDRMTPPKAERSRLSTKARHANEYRKANCRRFTPGMTATGRQRFASCLAAELYPDASTCLWPEQLCRPLTPPSWLES